MDLGNQYLLMDFSELARFKQNCQRTYFQEGKGWWRIYEVYKILKQGTRVRN